VLVTCEYDLSRYSGVLGRTVFCPLLPYFMDNLLGSIGGWGADETTDSPSA
jgi:hypothetical protein